MASAAQYAPKFDPSTTSVFINFNRSPTYKGSRTTYNLCMRVTRIVKCYGAYTGTYEDTSTYKLCDLKPTKGQNSVKRTFENNIIGDDGRANCEFWIQADQINGDAPYSRRLEKLNPITISPTHTKKNRADTIHLDMTFHSRNRVYIDQPRLQQRFGSDSSLTPTSLDWPPCDDKTPTPSPQKLNQT